MVNLTTRIGSLTLKNPVMPGSGTFSEDLAKVFDLEMLGAHVTKTITRELRDGNPTPRVAEISNGMLNSIGIPSKGVGYFKANILPFYRRYQAPLVVSVQANTADDFARICEEVDVPGVAAIEVNISCPNIEEDGKAFAMHASSTATVMRKVRRATDLPIWAKLTPNTGSSLEVAEAAEKSGADALVVANTVLAMSIDVDTFKPTLGNIMGGFSGPAIKPINLRMAYQCCKVVDIPVIGSGGISTGRDAVEYLLAGARAVQVGTATFVNPTAMLRVIDELTEFCDARGIAEVGELVGAVDDENAPDGAVLARVDA